MHIADVTHFVKPGSAIDLEAADRSTSTYLVERRLDMLPGLLTTSLCSLVGGVDRFAFSVQWEMTPPPECRVVRREFFKSCIHSRAAMTYGNAQDMIDRWERALGNAGPEKKKRKKETAKKKKKKAEKNTITNNDAKHNACEHDEEAYL